MILVFQLLPVLIVLLGAMLVNSSQIAAIQSFQPVVCNDSKVDEIIADASVRDKSVDIDCSVVLPRLPNGKAITKQLIFTGTKASNVTFDCNDQVLEGGSGSINFDQSMILILSTEQERAHDIIIKRCKINGSVRIGGGKPIEGYRASSRRLGHTKRMRETASTNIILDNVTITGVGGSTSNSPIYVESGVTYFQLINSRIRGKSSSVAIYLDAESGFNTIKHNLIEVDTKREVIAVDGSSNNKILDNRISGLGDGGIYLYRNCGEKGTVRHQTPQYNAIMNNVFVYDHNTDKPSIYLGSRDGRTASGNPIAFCDKDRDYHFGSGLDDRDFARYNIVAQNQFYWKGPFSKDDNYIKSRNRVNDSPNIIFFNEVVLPNMETQRLAGCYVHEGSPTHFVLHGRTIEVLGTDGKAVQYICNDGELERSWPDQK